MNPLFMGWLSIGSVPKPSLVHRVFSNNFFQTTLSIPYLSWIRNLYSDKPDGFIAVVSRVVEPSKDFIYVMAKETGGMWRLLGKCVDREDTPLWDVEHCLADFYKGNRTIAELQQNYQSMILSRFYQNKGQRDGYAILIYANLTLEGAVSTKIYHTLVKEKTGWTANRFTVPFDNNEILWDETAMLHQG